MAFCLLFALLPLLTPAADAAAKITESVNLTHPREDMKGPGYHWDNYYETLTLDGLYIETDDALGMRIPDKATVILKGKNYITAANAALAVPGDVTFKGNGTLILNSPNMGIYFYSTNDNTVARFLEGNFEITAGGTGLYSEHTTISVTGGKINVSSPAADKFAIDGREIRLHGGKLTLDNSVHAALSLEVRNISLNITSAKPALTADKLMRITDVSLKTGASASELKKTEEYGGENCLKTASTVSGLGSSILFGDKVPMFVDILIALVLLLLIGAGIGLPVLRAQRKAKEARAAIAETLGEKSKDADKK